MYFFVTNSKYVTVEHLPEEVVQGHPRQGNEECGSLGRAGESCLTRSSPQDTPGYHTGRSASDFLRESPLLNKLQLLVKKSF